MPWPGEPSLYELIESVLDFVSNMDKEQKTMTIGEDYAKLSKKITDGGHTMGKYSRSRHSYRH